jgi:hypothetical protein
MIARDGKSTNQNYHRQAPEFATSINVDTGGEFRRPVRRPTAELQSVTCAFWL